MRDEFRSFVLKNNMQLFSIFFSVFLIEMMNFTSKLFFANCVIQTRHAVAWRLGAQRSSTSHSNWRVWFLAHWGRWLACRLDLYGGICSMNHRNQAEIETKSTCAAPDSWGGFILSPLLLKWIQYSIFGHMWHISKLESLKKSIFLISQPFQYGSPDGEISSHVLGPDSRASRALKVKAWWSLMCMRLHPWS